MVDFSSVPSKETRSGSRVRPPGLRGFTLVELLVSTAIMLIVMLVLLQVIAGMTNIWHNSTGTISTFQGARAAFTTLTRTLSRATLKTYIDYVDVNGNPIVNTSVNGTNFTPIASFSRSSELHFICGPPTQIYARALANFQIQPASAPLYPGDCVFFQAPLGVVNPDTTAYDNGSSEKFLQKSLNTVGFYVTYSALETTTTMTMMPVWLATAMGVSAAGTNNYRYRLMEFVEPTENMDVYDQTYNGSIPGSGTAALLVQSKYGGLINDIVWAMKGTNLRNFAFTGAVGQYNQSVIVAENIPLLIIRPRLEPQDEQILANSSPSATVPPAYLGVNGGNTPYGPTTANSIISPNYNYDSRAWWGYAMTPTGSGGYTMTSPLDKRFSNTTVTVNGVSTSIGSIYAQLMRNQLPPILDVAMVAVDPNSLVRLGALTATPPTALQVPATMTGNAPNGQPYATQVDTTYSTPFSGSANMDVDLYNYGLWLASNHIRYRTFRASVQVEGAAWVNSY